MKDRVRLLFGLMILFNVIIGGLGLVRLFSWKSLLGIDRFFYIFASVLFVFSLYLAYLFSKPDDVPVVKTPVVKKVDQELKDLRKELDKVPEVPVPNPNNILRNPEPMRPIPPIVTRLTEDISMYQDRNIIKPPIIRVDSAQEKEDNEYSGVF